MFLHGFGSPLLTLGRTTAKPVPSFTRAKVMHRGQVVQIAFTLFAIGLVSAIAMVVLFYPAVASGEQAMAYLARNVGFGAGVLAFSLAFLTVLYRQFAPITAPVYALAGGVFMSGLALYLEARFPGIAVQSIFLSLAVFCVMLLLYATGMVKVSRKLFTIIYAATAAIALTYLLGFLLLLLDIRILFLHGAGTGGVLWFGFIVVMAAMNLLVDFERISQLEARQQPTFMPWYVGLGLMITLVWLYISILRLLANLRR